MRFDIFVKSTQGSGHQIAIGSFPPEFEGNSKNCEFEVNPDHLVAKEEVRKIKKRIKLGRIVEEDCGTKTNNYKGVEFGGQSAKHVLFVLENKKFCAYPVDNWYNFK